MKTHIPLLPSQDMRKQRFAFGKSADSECPAELRELRSSGAILRATDSLKKEKQITLTMNDLFLFFIYQHSGISTYS